MSIKDQLEKENADLINESSQIAFENTLLQQQNRELVARVARLEMETSLKSLVGTIGEFIGGTDACLDESEQRELAKEIQAEFHLVPHSRLEESPQASLAEIEAAASDKFAREFIYRIAADGELSGKDIEYLKARYIDYRYEANLREGK